MIPEQHSSTAWEMTADQKVRAAAIQSAAAFCSQGAPIDDVLFVADVFAGYIQGGWQEALQIHATAAPKDGSSKVQDVELREQMAAGQDGPQETASVAPPQVPAQPPAPAPQQAPVPEAPEEATADIIPLAVRGTASKEQNEARRKIERTRRQRVDKILNLAKVAKTDDHRQRLIDDAHESGLDDFLIEVNGGWQKLGDYLASLMVRR